MRRVIPVFASAGMLLLASGALAAPEDPVDPVTPSAEVVEVAEAPAPRHPDGFGAEQTVKFGEPREDVFGMGETVEIAAPVDDNAFVMGREIIVSQSVGGDLFAMAETVRIDRAVAGDVYAMGAEVALGPQGSVGGEVYGLAGNLQLMAPIDGSLHAAAGTLELASTVGGDAELEFDELVLGDGAQIAGDLTYASPEPAEAIDGIVSGEVSYSVRTEGGEGGVFDIPAAEPSAGESVVSWFGWFIWDYLSKLIVGAVFLALSGVAAVRVASTVRDSPAASIGYGLVTLVVLPPAAILCIVTVVPMTLGFLGLLALGVLMYIGQIVTAQWLGSLILNATGREDATPYATLAVGLLPVSLAFSLPFVGFLAVLTASLLGMGAMVKALIRRDEAAAVVPA